MLKSIPYSRAWPNISMVDRSALELALNIVRGIQEDSWGTALAVGSPREVAKSKTAPPTVFISWAHAHRGWSKAQTQLWQESVASFSSSLRRSFGIDADVDLFHLHESVDWTRFGQKSVISSDRVIIVLSKAWAERWEGLNRPTEGAGAAREADTLHGLFSRNQSEWQSKLIIVLLPEADMSEVPLDLDRVVRVSVDPSDLDTYEDLLRNLTGQPNYQKPALGSVPDLPPLDVSRNVSTLRGELGEVRRQERVIRSDKTSAGRLRRSELEIQKAALLGIIEAAERLDDQ